MEGGNNLRNLERQFEKLIAAVDRMASASEKLNALAEAEREVSDQIFEQPGPPYCPHCSKINPQVRTQAEGAGLLSEFVLVMACAHCGHTFFGLVDSWAIAPDAEAAKRLRSERRAEPSDNGA